jgi:hypothetical protein
MIGGGRTKFDKMVDFIVFLAGQNSRIKGVTFFPPTPISDKKKKTRNPLYYISPKIRTNILP